MVQQTSLEAWKKKQEKFKGDAYRYLEALRILGGEAPDYQVADLLNWEKARVSARRNTCIALGRVEPAYEFVKNPKTGVNVMIWRRK